MMNSGDTDFLAGALETVVTSRKRIDSATVQADHPAGLPAKPSGPLGLSLVIGGRTLDDAARSGDPARSGDVAVPRDTARLGPGSSE